MDNGLYFIHEYQERENNDEDPMIRRLLEEWRVYCVKGDICKLEISQEEDKGQRLDRTRTIFVTNAEMIASRLARKCLGGEKHVNSVNNKVNKYEIYPADLCKGIMRVYVIKWRSMVD